MGTLAASLVETVSYKANNSGVVEALSNNVVKISIRSADEVFNSSNLWDNSWRICGKGISLLELAEY